MKGVMNVKGMGAFEGKDAEVLFWRSVGRNEHSRHPTESPSLRQQRGSRSGLGPGKNEKGHSIGGHSGSLRCSHTRQCHFLFRFFFLDLSLSDKKVLPSRFACPQGSYIIIIIHLLGRPNS